MNYCKRERYPRKNLVWVLHNISEIGELVRASAPGAGGQVVAAGTPGEEERGRGLASQDAVFTTDIPEIFPPRTCVCEGPFTTGLCKTFLPIVFQHVSPLKMLLIFFFFTEDTYLVGLSNMFIPKGFTKILFENFPRHRCKIKNK